MLVHDHYVLYIFCKVIEINGLPLKSRFIELENATSMDITEKVDEGHVGITIAVDGGLKVPKEVS